MSVISAANPQRPYCASDLESLFRQTFFKRFNTVLVGGAGEPLYQPSADKGQPHRIFYREDFFSSALHEIAHWCIAGVQRRKQQDFGYWYLPDGRDQQQQQAFEKVEVKPQALEWMFSVAAGRKFFLSADNLSGTGELSESFAGNVQAQAVAWCRTGMPPRGLLFIHQLESYYQTDVALQLSSYQQLPE